MRNCVTIGVVTGLIFSFVLGLGVGFSAGKSVRDNNVLLSVRSDAQIEYKDGFFYVNDGHTVTVYEP